MTEVLLQLKRRLAGVAARRTGFAICVHGEAGIGKTRAVTELLKNAPCASSVQRAVAPLAQIIQGLPRPKRLSEWLKRKLEQSDSSLETLLGLLEANAPFVLYLEDLHEANAAQQAIWLGLIVAVQRAKGVGLMLTSRVLLELPCEFLRLEPLDFVASTALLESEISTSLPLEASTWIFARAAGNPLFTLEFFRHLARLGLLWNDTKRWHWREPLEDTMPITVEALIEQLLFEMTDSPEQQLALQALALLEIRVPHLIITPNLWAEVAGLAVPELELARLHLQRRGILDLVGFAHPLFREITFKQSNRTVLATRALNALKSTQPEYAAEFLEDSNLAPDTAFATLMACAKSLATQPIRAAQLKVKAAQFLSGSAKANLLLEALAGLIHSEPKDALGIAESILELPDLPETTRVDAIYYATGALVTTSRNIVAAEVSLARLPAQFQHDARYISSLIGYLMMSGQPTRALETWELHSELHEIVETPVLIHVLSALMLTGQLQPAELLTTQILARANLTEREQMGVLNIRAISLAQLGHLEEAERVGLEAIALAEKLEQHNAVGAMLFNRAITLERSGQRELMHGHATRALVALEQAGNFGLAAQAQLMLANLDFESGRYEPAEERLNAAYVNLKQAPLSPFFVTVELSLVRFHSQRNLQYSQTLAQKYARDALQQAQILGQEKPIASSQVHLCLALCQSGQILEASQLLREALPILKDLPDSHSFYVLSAQAKILEAKNESAVQTWQLAIAKAEALGFEFDAHCYRLELARLEKDLVKARELRAWFLEKGLLHGVNLANQYFMEFENAAAQTAPPDTRLEVLGTMQISSNSLVSSVKGQKRKELLAVLLEARILGRSEVKTLELIDLLYPNSPEEEALVSLRQTVFKARAAHGANTVATTANGYALGAILTDAEEFLRLGGIQLWRGTYLEGIGSSLEIQEMLTSTCQIQAQSLLETNPKEVTRVMRILLESNPYDLETLKIACHALRLDNNHRTLQRLYSETRAKLLEVAEVLPKRWQDFLSNIS